MSFCSPPTFTPCFKGSGRLPHFPTVRVLLDPGSLVRPAAETRLCSRWLMGSPSPAQPPLELKTQPCPRSLAAEPFADVQGPAVDSCGRVLGHSFPFLPFSVPPGLVGFNWWLEISSAPEWKLQSSWELRSCPVHGQFSRTLISGGSPNFV